MGASLIDSPSPSRRRATLRSFGSRSPAAGWCRDSAERSIWPLVPCPRR